MRKINDFKPLLAYLFPTIFDPNLYEWWGSCDNDMLIGNLTKFLPDSLLDQYDVISGSQGASAWGPFTMYRNTPTINTLFQKTPAGLPVVFVYRRHQAFDEFSNYNKADRNNSMTGILENYAPRLGLRVKLGLGEKIQDKREPCRTLKNKPDDCAECQYQNGKLMRADNTTELWLCHFQSQKKNAQHERSLQNDQMLDYFLQTGRFRSNWNLGWTYLPNDTYYDSNN